MDGQDEVIETKVLKSIRKASLNIGEMNEDCEILREVFLKVRNN